MRTCTVVAAMALAWSVWPVVAVAAQVSAQLDPDHVATGEASTLVVAIEGSGQVDTPRFDLPAGVQLLGTERAQSFSWINGKATSQLQFRFTLAAESPGTYPIGPVSVKVEGQELRSGMVALVVSAAPSGGGGTGGAPTTRSGRPPASLVILVEPNDPYVGQPVMMRARLIQRAPFASAPQYEPPTVTGFWTDEQSRPVSSYADEPGGRVLVTETRTRMFPLATGNATVGEATAQVSFATNGDPNDPLGFLTGGSREFTLKSAPVGVRVRPLPPGAPAGFGGAVGAFQVTWQADRDHGARDVPFTLHLNVRGRGNIPLVTAPAFDGGGLEVFAQTSDDSLGPAGEPGPGRKHFQWTVLARREGTLAIPAPAFSWFDPTDGRYHTAAPPPVRLQVGPAAFPGGAASPGGYPAALIERTVPASPRTAQPPVWTLAGGLLGFGFVTWRASNRRPVEAPERARALEWLRALGRAEGPDFWSAAEAAVEWMTARGHDVAGLAADVRRARYGGAGADPRSVRPRLVERLSAALPKSPDRVGPRVLASLAYGLAVAAVVLLGWGAPMTFDAGRMRLAESAARRGDLATARDGWADAWRSGVRVPALAARLGWVEAQLGDLGGATAWVLRGRRVDPRDPALEWVAARVREAGGLLGAPIERLPLTRLEWGIASLLLAALAGWWWSRRALAWPLALLALGCGVTPLIEAVRSGARPIAVVTRSCTLDPGGLELQPGQVVRLGPAHGATRDVRAGEERGHVPADALTPVDDGGARR